MKKEALMELSYFQGSQSQEKFSDMQPKSPVLTTVKENQVSKLLKKTQQKFCLTLDLVEGAYSSSNALTAST